MDSTAQPIQYFKKQEKIYPRRVWGRYRKLKWLAMAVLLGIYYGVPWLRWDRGPHVPDQAILIDMPNRRAYFFWIEIWPQEVYYITGLLIMAAVGLFFVTSLLGRVWCGYACPQTVWTDLFVWVERIVQGDRNARKKLDAQPLGFEKLWKKTLTHSIWLLIGLCTGGAWVFYFNDAPTLLDHILHLDIPWGIGIWIIGLTFSTYLMAGYAREQVCTYMCPYARFQSAMFDKNTLLIAYDEARGEPRGKWKKKQAYLERAAGKAVYGEDSTRMLADAKADAPQGDCIDCDSCVVVCPMGIDIRDGLQMECIACGLCVDACNSVMDKLSLPRGLIRYQTESREAFSLLKPRTFWYAGIMSAVGGIMLYTLATRAPIDMTVQHDRNPLLVTLSDGSIRNGYNVHIMNKTHNDAVYRMQVTGLPDASLQLVGSGELDAGRLRVIADSATNFRVFLHAEKQTADRKDIVFTIEDIASGVAVEEESVFVSKKP